MLYQVPDLYLFTFTLKWRHSSCCCQWSFSLHYFKTKLVLLQYHFLQTSCPNCHSTNTIKVLKGDWIWIKFMKCLSTRSQNIKSTKHYYKVQQQSTITEYEKHTFFWVEALMLSRSKSFSSSSLICCCFRRSWPISSLNFAYKTTSRLFYEPTSTPPSAYHKSITCALMDICTLSPVKMPNFF